MNSGQRAHIASIAVAVPPFSLDQETTGAILEKYFGHLLSPRSKTLLRTISAHPSIRKRHFAITDPESLVREDPDARAGRFTERSVALSAEAAMNALSLAGLSPGDVSCIVVNTCTGYICPGISTYLIERMGLPGSVRAYDLVGSGCGGAVPNLQTAEALLGHTRSGVALSISVEICTATFQMDDDLSLIISNTLFGDGAAAAVLWNRPEGLELVDYSSRYETEHRDAIRYIHKNGQLHNRLSTRLAHLVRAAAGRTVSEILSRNALALDEIGHWALHTGGEKIINGIRDEIGVPEPKLIPTRTVLSEYGNMSSPTVWFVLREILEKGMGEGEYCMMLVYGAGLSAHACLVRKKGRVPAC